MQRRGIALTALAGILMIDVFSSQYGANQDRVLRDYIVSEDARREQIISRDQFSRYDARERCNITSGSSCGGGYLW